MSAVLLVRHAHAGVRGTWPGHDLDRPLSDEGTAQARALVDGLQQLAEGPVTTIASSRAVRCLDTVRPLATVLGVELVEEPLLLEGADPASTLAWLESDDAPTVACSHGDVIGGVLTLLQARGVAPRSARWPKAGTWVLERDDDGRVTGATFVERPTVD